MAGIHRTQVNLDGLLEILGKNLYSTPAVALRELVQNAHDACERYQIETGEKKDFCIDISTNEQDHTLEIRDNGSGLTEGEIQKYLATIGSGYTRVLRNSSQSENMIGYFGLGFLSAYVVSTKVEVYTTSYKTPNECWLFSSVGGKSFSLSACPSSSSALHRSKKQSPNESVGTTVLLHLAEEFYSLAIESVLISLIEKYCCLLQVPIYINQSDEPANNRVAPWAISDSISTLAFKKKSLAFAGLFENDFEPICCIDIPQDNALGLKGVLWIQDGSSYESSDNRNVSIFVRNMFISNDIPELLPRWAGFIGGVFESIHFNPTASRESLQKDDYFHRVSGYIKERLIIGLRNIVLNEPAAWRRVLARHSQSLLGASLNDDRLFDVCCKLLMVPTSLGDMSLPQVISRSGGYVYIKPSSDSCFEDTLYRARRIPIISGFLYAAADFSRKYCEQINVPVRMLGAKRDESKLFPKQDINPELEVLFRQLLCEPNEELVISNFEPNSIPLLVIEDLEVKLKKKIEDDTADKRIGSAALSLARIHTKKITDQYEKRVYINLQNPLIRQLGDQTCQNRQILAQLLRAFMDALTVSDGDTGDDFLATLKRFNEALLILTKQE